MLPPADSRDLREREVAKTTIKPQRNGRLYRQEYRKLKKDELSGYERIQQEIDKSRGDEELIPRGIRSCASFHMFEKKKEV